MLKKAFNSVRWSNLLETVEHDFHVPRYLLRMVDVYLRDSGAALRNSGKTAADGCNGRKAAQVSVLRTDLCDIPLI